MNRTIQATTRAATIIAALTLTLSACGSDEGDGTTDTGNTSDVGSDATDDAVDDVTNDASDDVVEDTNNNDTSVDTAPLPDPVVTIVTPEDNATITENEQFTVSFENFTIVPPGTVTAPNEGHLHVFFDGGFTIIEADTFLLSELSFEPIEPGEYDVTVQLVTSDHATIEGANDTISVTLITPPG